MRRGFADDFDASYDSILFFRVLEEIVRRNARHIVFDEQTGLAYVAQTTNLVSLHKW